MIEVIVAIVATFVPPDAVAGFRSTAPTYLRSDVDTREHLAAAVVAATATGTDPSLLLAVAFNESRYTSNVVAPESGGRVSCGAMTPYPRARCASASLAAQYLDGARHLRGWLDAARDERMALYGFAGGWRLIRACAQGGPRCYAPAMFRRRALWIRRAIAAGVNS